jgi:hypothetical protein
MKSTILASKPKPRSDLGPDSDASRTGASDIRIALPHGVAREVKGGTRLPTAARSPLALKCEQKRL